MGKAKLLYSPRKEGRVRIPNTTTVVMRGTFITSGEGFGGHWESRVLGREVARQKGLGCLQDHWTTHLWWSTSLDERMLSMLNK